MVGSRVSGTIYIFIYSRFHADVIAVATVIVLASLLSYRSSSSVALSPVSSDGSGRFLFSLPTSVFSPVCHPIIGGESVHSGRVRGV